jgi:hypothetical protein
MPEYRQFYANGIQGHSVKGIAKTLLTLVLLSVVCYSTESVLAVL